jgi:hypothetical protein
VQSTALTPTRDLGQRMPLLPINQNYLTSSELGPYCADLSLLAQRMVAQIDQDTSVYRPKRARGRVSTISRGWRERLRNYEWPYGVGFAEASHQVAILSDSLRALSVKLDQGQQLSPHEGDQLQEATHRVFRWGGVTRGTSKENPSVDLISSVILSALQWQRVDAAPMDSGWTKVAAFSTNWLDGTDRTPQVIYDSRVANSLLRNVEKLREGDCAEWVLGLLPTLQHHLRTVPGRGGTRDQPYQFRWKSGYGRWGAQFFASFLVRMMRDALNEDPQRYGLMPIADSPDTAWTMRGVEIVLFMDGY